MRRRRALFAAIVLVTAGCAGVLGLEDRHLGGDAETDAEVRGDGSALDAAARDGATDVTDAGTAGPLDICAEAGDLVYVFEAPGDCFRYGVDPGSIPAGFDDGGPAFRLVAPSVTFDMIHKKPLNLLRSRIGNTEDYLVSPIPDEDIANYQFVAELPSAYFNIAPDQQPPGTIEIRRFMRTTPKLRHKLFVPGDGHDASPDWTYDEKRYYVCPVK